MIIKTKAPVRISFGSCGDTDYDSKLIGWGNAINATVNLYAYCEIHKRDDNKIVLRTLETGSVLEYDSLESIKYDKREEDIAKAVIKHFGNTGIDIVTYTDAPLESGLGGSAAHTISLIKAFNQLNGLNKTNLDVSKLAYEIERNVLGISGGYQDQWASTFGGINYMKFSNGSVEVTPIFLGLGDLEFLENSILMVYLPREKHGYNIHDDLNKRCEKNMPILKLKRDNIEDLKVVFTEKKFSDLGRVLHMDWKLKKQLSPIISNLKTQEIYNTAVDAGALGGRFMGAGGGGCAIFYSDGKKEKILEKLEDLGAREIKFEFERSPINVENIKNKVVAKLEDHHNLIKEIINRGDVKKTIETITQKIIESYRNGGKVVIFGNGGSAADAQHIAGELVNRMYFDRPMLNSIALTVNTSVLTAIANDSSYDKIFSRQIEKLVEPKDVVIGISTSGNSPNVVEGLKSTKEIGALAVGFTGDKDGKMNEYCDIILKIPSKEVSRIQEGHILAAHIICELVEEELYGK